MYEVVAVGDVATLAQFYREFFSFNLLHNDLKFGYFSCIKEFSFLTHFCTTDESKHRFSQFVLRVLQNELNKQFAAPIPKIRNFHRHLATRVFNCEHGQLATKQQKESSILAAPVQDLFDSFQREIDLINSNHQRILQNMNQRFVTSLEHSTPPDRMRVDAAPTQQQLEASNTQP